MKRAILFFAATFGFVTASYACENCGNYSNDDFAIVSATVTHEKAMGLTVWEIKVKGKAGNTTPKPAGQLNGAPVLGYVFPTTLQPADVGFSAADGIVALALTSHPDFDDTPLWDENADRVYDNDGVVWHPHWIILVEDKRVAGGFSVREFDAADKSVQLPPTNPGMPMYMDSPGFNVVTSGNTIKVIVPDYRISNRTNFSFDAVTCFMEVNTGEGGGHSGGNGAKPMLGVYKVYSVASGDLSLPYNVSE